MASKIHWVSTNDDSGDCNHKHTTVESAKDCATRRNARGDSFNRVVKVHQSKGA